VSLVNETVLNNELTEMEGKDEWEIAHLDELNELWNEYLGAITEYIYVKVGLIPGDKVELTFYSIKILVLGQALQREICSGLAKIRSTF
jgi:hypothetical protein